ncbi:hypothetical protein BAUCODRAFT_68720 [Baudoinia panamericana UAMH 10762]|uniref:PLC-like phosphodiesterase n=1 Tax=Baudoinia panamericana (strain UAMH 10762) TaxID=717646 RepID=M2N0R1_BAUPA|nr:uncharacterized protein BAUCODRAFT_68720 [Baudoinia panamericana UAMH 10762]EMC97503.1 hypothetical protein BAUCODRAFT_68720 [Baudoinia panamericana UAMH 10762]
MLPTTLWLLCLAAISARAQSDYPTYTGTFSTLSSVPTSDFAGSGYTYLTYTAQSSVSSSSNSNATATRSSNSQITRSTTSESILQITANPTSNSANLTATRTSSSATPVNTIPCNNYPEFCNRQYSNITEVCAHNSAFVVRNNAASNQQLSITDQLNDGVRMLQGETHYVNNTIYNCHTTCDLLNAGTWQSELETLVGWLEQNPYDVVTFLIVNSDYRNVQDYVAPIQNSGIASYLYEPEFVPQYRQQWPTLGHMILTGKRVVMFMDYNANQTEVPYILDEFAHIWETPFSPTNQSFPCSQQRPPGLTQQDAEERYMYLANHNLNTAVDLGALTGGSSSDTILIPNYAELNISNGASNQFGQLGAMQQNCTADWGRPPNFLLVDYYNQGLPMQGSVFEVAARANGVTYNRRCCGITQSAAPVIRSSFAALATALLFSVLLAW